MKAKLWGVRGSLPTPHMPETIEARVKSAIQGFLRGGNKSEDQIDAFVRTLPAAQFGGYGGNTACIEVSSNHHTAIIDAGSGIRKLGQQLMSGPLGMGRGEAHIFFTHFHWDHLIGLPFFVPIFIPGNTIHFYAVQPEMEECVKGMFQKPYFPVPFERLGAKLVFHQLEARKPHMLGDLQFTPYKLDHPDPCWGYKVVGGGKTFSYCMDTECTRTSREALGPDLPLYQGVDVMVFDAQYTVMEAAERIDWGHAAAPFGLDVAMREGIKKVYFVHHDPAASDERIADAESQTREYYQTLLESARAAGKKVHEVEWKFAHEGMLINF